MDPEETLLKAVICLDGSGTPQERVTGASLALAMSLLTPEDFDDPEARTRYSAIMERLGALEDVASEFEGIIQSTTMTMSDDEAEKMERAIRELDRLVRDSSS